MNLDTFIIWYLSILLLACIFISAIWAWIWVATAQKARFVCQLCGLVESIDEDGRCPECGQYVEIE